MVNMMMMNDYRDTTAKLYAVFAGEPAIAYDSDELSERLGVSRRAVQKAIKLLLADSVSIRVS